MLHVLMGCTRTFCPRDLSRVSSLVIFSSDIPALVLNNLCRVLFRAGGLWVVLLLFVFTLACRIGKKVRNRLAKVRIRP